MNENWNERIVADAHSEDETFTGGCDAKTTTTQKHRDEEETKKKCKVKKLFCISLLTRAWDVVLCIFDRSTRSRPPENRKNPSTEAAAATLKPPTAAADELVVKLRLWVSSSSSLLLLWADQKSWWVCGVTIRLLGAAGCRPSPT